MFNKDDQSLMERVSAVVAEHGAEESYLINDDLFMIINQVGRPGGYAVKVMCMNGFYESRWIKHPESRFETLGGARSAILTDIGDLILE